MLLRRSFRARASCSAAGLLTWHRRAAAFTAACWFGRSGPTSKRGGERDHGKVPPVGPWVTASLGGDAVSAATNRIRLPRRDPAGGVTVVLFHVVLMRRRSSTETSAEVAPFRSTRLHRSAAHRLGRGLLLVRRWRSFGTVARGSLPTRRGGGVGTGPPWYLASLHRSFAGRQRTYSMEGPDSSWPPWWWRCCRAISAFGDRRGSREMPQLAPRAVRSAGTDGLWSPLASRTGRCMRLGVDVMVAVAASARHEHVPAVPFGFWRSKVRASLLFRASVHRRDETAARAATVASD